MKALPKNLPDYISVDISNLHLNDKVTIQDLLNDNYAFVHPENMVVCQVKMSRASLSLTTGEEEGERRVWSDHIEPFKYSWEISPLAVAVCNSCGEGAFDP